MSKSYGGGAGTKGGGTGKSASVIGSAAPIKVQNEYHRSSRRYGYTVLEASDKGNGVLELDYASGTPRRVNNNTTIYDITLNAGVYNQMGDRRLKSHNIDWQMVKEVRAPFGVGDYLKSLGFKWNPTDKTWKR